VGTLATSSDWRRSSLALPRGTERHRRHFFRCCISGKRKTGSTLITLLGGSKPKDWQTPFWPAQSTYAAIQRFRRAAVAAFYFMRVRYAGASWQTLALPFLFDARAHDGREFQMYTAAHLALPHRRRFGIFGASRLYFDFTITKSHAPSDSCRCFGRSPPADKSSSLVFNPPIALWVRNRYEAEGQKSRLLLLPTGLHSRRDEIDKRGIPAGGGLQTRRFTHHRGRNRS